MYSVVPLCVLCSYGHIFVIVICLEQYKRGKAQKVDIAACEIVFLQQLQTGLSLPVLRTGGGKSGQHRAMYR